ncbi:hypothetical protein BD289DRAFT_443592 [Coniella lustricola]|uniref:Uncharacterized protein n=1 Tax=Coniella lustricola TaxID=2025994 RepID=A0A2T2ZWT1_9PEZI|nr:hypothetical protein BD289DRAFT_443592 [Coniella lustricola]
MMVVVVVVMMMRGFAIDNGAPLAHRVKGTPLLLEPRQLGLGTLEIIAQLQHSPFLGGNGVYKIVCIDGGSGSGRVPGRGRQGRQGSGNGGWPRGRIGGQRDGQRQRETVGVARGRRQGAGGAGAKRGRRRVKGHVGRRQRRGRGRRRCGGGGGGGRRRRVCAREPRHVTPAGG